MHDIVGLLEAGHKKQKLRAHSDFYPNEKTNDWALSFGKTSTSNAKQRQRI